MKTYNNITLKYRNSERSNYMGLSDLAKDLETETLIEVLPTIEKFNQQMLLVTEIDSRKEISQMDLCELLESCNGI